MARKKREPRWTWAAKTATETAAGKPPRPPGDRRKHVAAVHGRPGHPARQGPGAHVPGLRGSRTNERRVQLAKEALAVCPDCADAYVLLAEHARRRKETLPCTNKAWPQASERWAHTFFSEMSATFGAFSKPGRTCVPGWAWPTPSGPLAGVTRPCGTCRTCSG